MPSATIPNPFLYLQANADANPNGVFSQSPDQRVTNAEAVVSAKKLAYELRRLGVAAGDVVALDLPDQLSILFAEAVYHEAAVSTALPDGFSADGAFPIHWVFTRSATRAQAGARTVVVDARFLQQVDQNPYGISPSTEPIETLRIVFSSGTTGTPKAIALGREMESLLDAALPTWFAGGPYVTLMDTATAPGFGEFYLSVKGGQPFLCVGGAAPADIVRLADQYSVRSLKGSAAQVAGVVAELEGQGRTLPKIETVIVGGTVMPPGVAERMRRAAEGCQIFGNYGSTEAGTITARLYASDDPYDAGHVVPGSALQIVDEDDRQLPDGDVGAVRTRSWGMVQGYLGDEQATALAFRDGWFYPGDLGFIRPDGGLTLTGRQTEVLNAGGVKIDPNRIDHFALELPGVLDAGSFDYPTTSGLRQIGIAVVAADDIDAGALVSALTAEFGTAAPKLVARIDEIPRTATGKPLRRTLSEKYAEN